MSREKKGESGCTKGKRWGTKKNNKCGTTTWDMAKLSEKIALEKNKKRKERKQNRVQDEGGEWEEGRIGKKKTVRKIKVRK